MNAIDTDTDVITMDKKIPESWVLYSIRETLGLTEVRNSFLKKNIEKLGRYPKNSIIYGNMYTSGNTYSEIHEAVRDLEGSNKEYLIFTANGEVTKNPVKVMGQVESHYVSFIVIKKESRVIIVDPSRNKGKDGIYHPYIGYQLIKFFEDNGYATEWLEMTKPCQTKYHDVFCQSWTLYLVYTWFKVNQYHTGPVDIPRSQKKRYEILLKMFKKLLFDEKFYDELMYSYHKSIKNHKRSVALGRHNPCILLNSMKAEDMY